MDISRFTRKDIGMLGEKAVAEYLRRYGFEVIGMNVGAKFGELDCIARKEDTLHFVEVKSLRCIEFPNPSSDTYDPSQNLHQEKIRKVARLGAWYVAAHRWEGDWQVDGALVWLREHDGMARIRYYPQIL